MRLRQRYGLWLAVGALALLAYVPALASSPGRMPADTKLYLYLNPGRLIGDAPFTFDARQFAGWVPHQVIAYLWPQGPWFWLGETVGLPDWVTHRLWLGTLFLAAGAGVLWAARRLGLGLAAAVAAAIAYQVAPYILPYVSRTSAMLLPWAGLGWIVGLTVGAATSTRWRHAALAALVVFTVGAVNATALMMIVPAPLLWLVVAAAERQITWRRAATTAVKIGGLSLAVSLWWLAMLVIQGRHGADVLAYSESLESVSFTSTSPEVWRGLGYWLFYLRDAYAATTTAARDYMVSGRLIVDGFVLLLLAMAGVVCCRWRHRRYAIALIVTGVILGVGVHPITDPSPLMDAIVGDTTSGAALALRSSTRAVPVLMLGLALGLGMLVDALAPVRLASRVSLRPVAAVVVALVAVFNLPSLTGHRLVDPALERDEDPPAAWTAAAAALDDAPDGYRVLQLPGAEFGAFRWGYTVDPPLPGLTDRPLVTRDLLPLGSPQAMDLLYALDDRFQSGTVEPESIAPIARLLGADTVWVTGDAAFDRFRTSRPEIVHDLFARRPDGLGEPRPFGEPLVNVPDIPMVDEVSASDRRIGEPVPPVELVPVDEPVAVIRAKDEVVVVAGSGDGLIDAAAAGLVDGRELVRYLGSLSSTELADALAGGARVIVTDSNRDRAHHWGGSQDVWGYTESDGTAQPEVLRRNVLDERLPVFEDSAAYTVARQVGPVRALASAYGEPFAYRPEDRAFMAVDGDPATAWRVADRFPAEGELIRLEVAEPMDHVTLQQPAGAEAVRHVGRVSIEVDDGPAFDVELDDRSHGSNGQRIDIEPTTGPSTVTITIESVVVPDPTLGPALAAVGFAEIGTGLGPTVEVVRPPADGVAAIASAGDAPVSFVLTRLRTRPNDRWRSDPEPAMVREIELPGPRSLIPTITVRLDQRADDDQLADLLGIAGPRATSRLTGVAAASGWAATDDDRATAWITPFGGAVGAALELTVPEAVGEFAMVQPAGDYSPITGLRVVAGDQSLDVTVPPPDGDGVSRVRLPGPVVGPVRLEVTTIERRFVLDRRYAEPVVLPAAISELSLGERTLVPDRLDTGCRDDLVQIDGEPIPVRVEAAVADLVAGEAVEATPCGSGTVALDDGTHRLTTTPGATTGIHVDRVVLADRPAPVADGAPTVTVDSQDRLGRRVTVDGCPDGCWLVLGEGFNESWSAEIADRQGGSAASADRDLGAPQLVDGGFNGWWIPPSDGPTEVRLRWTVQTPLNIALVLTVLAVLACIALAVLDRRRVALSASPAAEFEFPGPRQSVRAALVTGGLWAVATLLLVGPGFALLAIVGAAALVVVRRPRLVGLVTIGILVTIGAVIVWVVRDERPWPDGGWPVRFEWLHGWGMFAAVTLAVTLAVPTVSSAASVTLVRTRLGRRRTRRTSNPPTS
jgi:arabinofuranan 3-O-arabinosyltransferase